MKSFLVPDSAEPGYSAIMRNPRHPTNIFPDPAPNTSTLDELFRFHVHAQPTARFMGTRKYNPVTRKFLDYSFVSRQEALQRVEHFGAGLDLVYQRHAKDARGVMHGTNRQLALGLYSVNRAEWLLAEFGGFRSNKFSVALYDTLGAESVEYIIEHAHIAVIVCSLDKVPRLLRLKDRLPSLRVIISMDAFEDHGRNPAALPFTVNSIRVLHEWAGAKDVVLMDMPQVTQLGQSTPTVARPPKPSDLCTICYTSGTTGRPKGAMATHASYTFSAKSASQSTPVFNPVYLSFLPLAHCYERNNIYAGLVTGGCVGFYSGDILRISEDAQELRPTMMSGVPRLYNRIYDRIAAATIYAPGLSGVIARTAIRQKLERLENGQGFTHPFWDRIVCNKIRQFFGGNLEMLVSGSAPIDAKVLSFLRVALAVTIVEGYASTECNAAATVTLVDEQTAGHVGVPYPGMEIRLRDVPEMNYLATDKPCARGEVLIRGGSVFAGYLNDADQTRAAFDGDWLVTGDIGQFNLDGNLKIIDRRKNILKLSHGEYVAVEFLETVYSRCPLVQNIYVHGDSLESSLVAVVVPDPETFVPWARKISGRSTASLGELCGDEQITGALLVELRVLGREAKLQGFEILAAIHCDPAPFDIEGNGLLTSTFKLKRDLAKKHYDENIQQMYLKLKGSPK
ncbi:medium-chain fatty acid-CoA ligase faa2 [Coemansia erecta]|uniref:Medium-chain fatty acid-CoA ligase faa2 n=1 Tax=Coemansia erecta TaxID=147472 RepID=A0A9W7Y2T4_9FUNG|nr:medium-chain fatty acid-CoA ligase faa2 [Coemansia erecta]